MFQTNPSKFDEMLFSGICFLQITCETRNRKTGLYLLRQGVPEGHFSKGYASLNKSNLNWP